MSMVRISERKAKENTKFFHFAFPNESIFDDRQWYEKTGKKTSVLIFISYLCSCYKAIIQKAINLFYHGTAQRNG